MRDVEKVRKGLALLIGGVVAWLIGLSLAPKVPEALASVPSALIFGGVAAVAVGLVWLLGGLWRGDRDKTSV